MPLVCGIGQELNDNRFRFVAFGLECYTIAKRMIGIEADGLTTDRIEDSKMSRRYDDIKPISVRKAVGPVAGTPRMGVVVGGCRKPTLTGSE